MFGVKTLILPANVKDIIKMKAVKIIMTVGIGIARGGLSPLRLRVL